MDTIHKKNGKLHIYVRQDKYKGELKSHNWVGRASINGKQKVSSSGTANLEEAIPILEKWFDELQLEKNDDIQVNKSIEEQSVTVNQEQSKTSPVNEENGQNLSSGSKLEKPTDNNINKSVTDVTIGMLEKLKTFKFSKSNNVNKDNNKQSNQVNKASKLKSKLTKVVTKLSA